MSRTAEVPFRDHVFHVLRAAARPGLRLLPGPLPRSVHFRYEAVDDSRDPSRQAVEPHCRGDALCVDRAGERLPPATARHGEFRRPRFVTDRFGTSPARTCVAVCGSVRIPLRPAAMWANRRSRNPLPTALCPTRCPSLFVHAARARATQCADPCGFRSRPQPCGRTAFPESVASSPMPQPAAGTFPHTFRAHVWTRMGVPRATHASPLPALHVHARYAR